MTVQARTLADYRPQHDAVCATQTCVYCNEERDMCLCQFNRNLPFCHKWPGSVKCSCGLDTLLAASSAQQDEKDHGAELAAAPTIPDVAERLPASGQQAIDLCYHIALMNAHTPQKAIRVHEWQRDYAKIMNALSRFVSEDANRQAHEDLAEAMHDAQSY